MAHSGLDSDFNCAVCLYPFEDPTLLICGHTFCRGCLERIYNRGSHHDRITCPECRKVTDLCASGVDGLPPNIALKRVLDRSKDMTNAATNKPIVDTDDNDQRRSPCSEHAGEFKNMFCENEACRMTICPECLIKSHNGHNIKTCRGFIKEQEKSVCELGKHCQQRKELILGKINLVENRREEVNNIMRNRKEEIVKAYEEKLLFLKNNKESLVERLTSLELAYNSDLDGIRARYDQMIEDIDSKYDIVSCDVLKDFERESLTRHLRRREELGELLKKPVYEDSAMKIAHAAKCVKFHKSGSDFVSIGKIEGNKADTRKELPVIQKGLGTIGQELGMSLPVEVCMEVEVGKFVAMAALNKNTVVLGYGFHRNGADAVSVNGNKVEFIKSNAGKVAGITILSDGRSVVYDGDRALSLFNADGTVQCRKFFALDRRPCAIQRDPHNNVYAINEGNEISVFTCDAKKQKRTIITEDSGHQQICVTSSGFIVAGTQCNRAFSNLTVYDSEGNRCSVLGAERSGEELYFATNIADNGFLARIQQNVLRLSFCKLRNNCIVERMKYRELTLDSVPLYSDFKWHFVCLSPSLLAAARGTKLFFIEI